MLTVKNPPDSAGDIRDFGWLMGWEDLLEEEMATHSSNPAWRIPGTEEPGGLQFMGVHIVWHNWSDLAHTHVNKLSEAPGTIEIWLRKLEIRALECCALDSCVFSPFLLYVKYLVASFLFLFPRCSILLLFQLLLFWNTL